MFRKKRLGKMGNGRALLRLVLQREIDKKPWSVEADREGTSSDLAQLCNPQILFSAGDTKRLQSMSRLPGSPSLPGRDECQQLPRACDRKRLIIDVGI